MVPNKFTSGSLTYVLSSQTVNFAYSSYSEIEQIYQAETGNPDIDIQITIRGRGRGMPEAYQDLQNKIQAMGGNVTPKPKGT